MKEKNLSKLMGLAVNDYEMIQADDKIVIGISGGIDSFALIALMYFRLNRIPIHYTLYPVFVDIFNGKNEGRNEMIQTAGSFIKERFQLNLDVIKLPISDYLEKYPKNTCFKCAQIRRSELIKYAEDKGCNKIALGHHKDDMVETILMNLFYKRELSSMMPRLPIFEGKFEIIRPMVYLEKRQITRYVSEMEAPIITEACPAKMIKNDLRREKVREFIPLISKEFPDFKNNIFAALRNPQPDYMLDRFFNPKTSGLHKRP